MAGTSLTGCVTDCGTWKGLIPVVLLFGVSSVTTLGQTSSPIPPLVPKAELLQSNPFVTVPVGVGKRVRDTRPTASSDRPMATTPVFNITGAWTDSLGVEVYELNQSPSGIISGGVDTYDCEVPIWPVSGSITGNEFTITATNPTGGNGNCLSSYFTLVETLAADGNSATGSFTSYSPSLGFAEGPADMTFLAGALLITTTSLPTATAGLTYSTALSATGGIQPYSFSVASGTLPDGFILDAPTGIISSSGSPIPAPGPYPLTFQVTDSTGAMAPFPASLPLTVLNGLSLTSNGAQVLAKGCATISSKPSMPRLVASLTSNQGLSGTVDWSLAVQYTGPDSPQTTFSFNTHVTSLPANHSWTVPFGGTFIGGDATLTYTYQGATQTFDFCIDGKNPEVKSVKDALGTDPWFLPDIAYVESLHTYHQFDSDGDPLFGAPHGFGIMQLDPPPSQLDVFDWVQNLNDGIDKVNSLESGAAAFWDRQVAQYTAWADDHDDTPPPPGNDSEGSCVFGYAPAGTEYSFSDAIWIKQYNGATANYIAWANTGANKNNPMWVFHRCSATSAGEVCYVKRICEADQ